MRTPYTQLYLHLVWSTWDRHPFLTDAVQGRVYDCIQAECTRMRTDLVAIGGIVDHVHVLVRAPATVAPADLVKQIKGTSSHLVNHEVRPPFFFKWQGAYGAFSVSEKDVPMIRAYVLRQEERHRDGNLDPDLEPPPSRDPEPRGGPHHAPEQ